MVELRGVTIGYGRRELARGLSCSFAAGTLNAVIGRNGAGKSTLLRVIAGLGKPLSGVVNYELRDASCEFAVQKLPQLVSFVSTERVRVANLSVGEFAALGRMPWTGWGGRLSAQDLRIVERALEAVGMAEMAGKQIDTLSDGELQRAAVARALAQDTPVVVLDEPTAFLDFDARREMVELLSKLAHERGKTVIFSSHELDLVNEFSDKIVEL